MAPFPRTQSPSLCHSRVSPGGTDPSAPPPQNLPLGFELPALGRSVARAFPTGLVPSASIRCTHVLAQGRGLGTNAITLGLKEQGERWQAASRLTCG